jgi:16S rRNA (cytosine1402-N4)-methyltransferase
MSSGGAADQIHTSVLLNETLRFLKPSSGGVYVDGTLGLGGHSLSILEKSGPDGKVIAFEWDESAIEKARVRLSPYHSRLKIIRRNFAEIAVGLDEARVTEVDGMLIDVGLSSLQLDLGGRGFSFQRDEILDMRMDNRQVMTAESVLATCSQVELADIFFYYGEERQARPIASAIVEYRAEKAIKTTKELVSIIVKAVPKRFHPKKIHVATKVFQALRIAVNGELENLAKILEDGVRFLKPGSRFCVISFHSLEDRIVKAKFKNNKDLEVLTTKAVMSSPEEVAANKRSRSARLRVAQKKDK